MAANNGKGRSSGIALRNIVMKSIILPLLVFTSIWSIRCLDLCLMFLGISTQFCQSVELIGFGELFTQTTPEGKYL